MNSRMNTARTAGVSGIALTICWLPLLGLCLAGGCNSPHLIGLPTSRPAAGQTFSKQELHDALGQFEDFFETTLKQTAAQIDERNPDTASRKLSLLWRVRMLPAIHAALKEDDAVRAYLNAWTVTVRMTHFFVQGAGRDLFGKQQHLAIAASRQIEAEIERIGSLFLSHDKLLKAHEEALAFANTHPIREGFAGAFIRPATTKEGGFNAFNAIMSVPLTPFRVMEGIDHTAAAINRFSDVADRFTDVVEELPETTAWEAQLALLEIEDHPTIRSIVTSLEQFGLAAAGISETARALPDQLRYEGTRLIEEIDARQANIQVTLSQAENTAALVERSLAKLDGVAESIDRTAKSVTDTGKSVAEAARAIDQTYKDIEGDTPPTTQAATVPASQPTTQAASTFDINDYRKTADAMTAMAAEVRQVTEQIRQMIQTQELTRQISDVDTRVRGTIDQTGGAARSLADHVAWRGLQLILAIFAMAIVYKLLSVRLTPKTP